MITLSKGTTTLELPDRLIWTDEFSWSPTAMEMRWGTEGSPHIHIGTRKAGRPISLDGQDTQAWITRALCVQLEAWAAQADAQFTLVLRGQPRTVIFDQAQSTGFTATPVWKLVDSEHTDDLIYRPSFKFIEV